MSVTPNLHYMWGHKAQISEFAEYANERQERDRIFKYEFEATMRTWTLETEYNIPPNHLARSDMHRRQEESQVPLRQQVSIFRRNGGVNKTLNIYSKPPIARCLINSHHFPTNASADFSHATNFKAKAKLGNAKKGAAATTCLAAHLHCLLPKKSKWVCGYFVLCDLTQIIYRAAHRPLCPFPASTSSSAPNYQYQQVHLVWLLKQHIKRLHGTSPSLHWKIKDRCSFSRERRFRESR